MNRKDNFGHKTVVREAQAWSCTTYRALREADSKPKAQTIASIGDRVWWHPLREEFKARATVTEVYVHTTELRGREDKHASDYEPPLEGFIDVDTTSKSVEDALGVVLEKSKSERIAGVDFPTNFVGHYGRQTIPNSTPRQDRHLAARGHGRHDFARLAGVRRRHRGLDHRRDWKW